MASRDSSVFKKKAQKIEKDLGDKATVVINRDKPGKGNFVVKLGDNTIVELKGLEKPFTALKELKVEDLIEKILTAAEETKP